MYQTALAAATTAISVSTTGIYEKTTCAGTENDLVRVPHHTGLGPVPLLSHAPPPCSPCLLKGQSLGQESQAQACLSAVLLLYCYPVITIILI